MSATWWTIDTMLVGQAVDVPADVIIFHDKSGRTLTVPMISFVLRSETRTIVVDTGGPLDSDHVPRHHGFGYEFDDSMHPLAGLDRLGVSPDHVDLVINTHLHWDHSFNNHLFPNAEVLVQEAELNYAVHPSPAHLKTYEIHEGGTPGWISCLDRIKVAKGFREVADGVAVVPLPGHSPGSQGITVDTREGTFVITGDCVDTMENWNGDGIGNGLPSGGFTDLPAFYESLAFLKESGWTPLPSHDLSVVERGRYG